MNRRDDCAEPLFATYLPKAWVNDPERCNASHIPIESQVMKSKSDLALEIVRHNRSLGVRFNWVGLDGGYGKAHLKDLAKESILSKPFTIEKMARLIRQQLDQIVD